MMFATETTKITCDDSISEKRREKRSNEYHESQSLNQAQSHVTRKQRTNRRRKTIKYRTTHAKRERTRVGTFNVALCRLRKLLPTFPPDRKMTKIDVLRVAISYIEYLNHMLGERLRMKETA